MTLTSLPVQRLGVHEADDLAGAVESLHALGFAVLRGVWSEAELQAMEAECVAAQAGVVSGTLSDRYGTVALVDDVGGRTARFANYVTSVTEVAPAVRAASLHPAVRGVAERILGDCYLMEGGAFGVVYQDARPGPESSYSRIGWHSDWQSGPHQDRWPSLAFTLHVDATSPANGFLRVVPGSHRWATPAPFRNANGVPVPEGSKPTGGWDDVAPPFEMPLGFERIPGELGVYCERGDLLFHDAYLWHSAARATVDGRDPASIRRHIRGGYFTGDEAQAGTISDFVKNAAR